MLRRHFRRELVTLEHLTVLELASE